MAPDSSKSKHIVVASTCSDHAGPKASLTLRRLSAYPLPPSFLLSLDGADVLLDCGALDSVSATSDGADTPTLSQVTAYLSLLRSLAPSLSLVILSHPLTTSCALLPWLKSRCGLRCPVYSTLPTREMGRWAVEEWVLGKSAEEKNERRRLVLGKDGKIKEVDMVTAATAGGAGGAKTGKRRKLKKSKEDQMDVDEEDEAEPKVVEDEGWDQVWKVSLKEVRDAFSSITAVRWTQPIHLSGPLKGYTLTFTRSGHTLGGSLITIRPSLSSSLSPASSASSFLYIPAGFNHIKEHHLDGTALLTGAEINESMRRMGVVLVGAERSMVKNLKRSERERALLDLITKTLKSSSSLLLPTDPSARLFELLLLLESHWLFEGLQRFPLCLVSKTGQDVVTFVRSLTEWMGGGVREHGGEKILNFSNLRIYPSVEALNASIPSHIPKLILTVPSTLSYGPSRELFVELSRSAGNVIILTGKSEAGSLGRWLWEKWEGKQKGDGVWGGGAVGNLVELEETVQVEMKKKVYLAGEELAAFKEEARLEAEASAKRQAALERSRRMLNVDVDDASDDSDSDSGSSVDDANEDELEEGGGKVSRKLGGWEGGAGAWDEFLDLDQTGNDLTIIAGTDLVVAGKVRQSFDIFVKGTYAVRNLDSTSGGLKRFRMFPVVERKRRVDAYGEAVDVEGWLKRGIEDDGGAEGDGLRKLVTGGKRDREEVELEETEEETPHKYLVELVDAHLLCSVFALDMEGRADGRALKTILPQINPRKLVIVDGSDEAIQDLAAACRAVNAMTKDIFTPSVGETLVVAEATKNFSVRLGDSIMAALKMSRVDDYDVAYVAGVIHFDAESDIPVLERASLTSGPVLSVPTILPAPSLSTTTVTSSPKITPTSQEVATIVDPHSRVLPPLPPALFIGDLRLTQLKDLLAALRVPAEFAGEGVLICGPSPGAEVTGRVAVRKVGRGKLILEGSPGETFYVVRKTIYSLHAAGG